VECGRCGDGWDLETGDESRGRMGESCDDVGDLDVGSQDGGDRDGMDVAGETGKEERLIPSIDECRLITYLPRLLRMKCLCNWNRKTFAIRVARPLQVAL
jgi:hypothetical protein